MAGGLIAGTSLLVASPAYAAPGDASAIGAETSLNVDVAGIVIDVDASVGEVGVMGEGSDTSEEQDYTLVDAQLADITVGAVSTSASSDPAGSEASSVISGVDASLLGLDLLTVEAASAEVTCPTDGAATAEATLAGVTLLGDAVEITAGPPAVTATASLGVVEGGTDLTGLELTISVSQVETVDDEGAIAIALVALVSIDGTVGTDEFADVVVASITLAGAACEAPLVAPVTATAITPQVGPTTGGQTVTITGSGFGPSTTVDFGADPATDIVVSADGTSLTAVTPPGAAGPTTVTVANPGGTSAELDYTYVAPAAATLTPPTGPEYGGTTVTITGTGLDTVTGVDFGGTAATIVSVSPDGTQVVVTAPPGTGTVEVTLDLAGGSSITSAQDYTYVPVAVTAIDPDSGPSAGGTTVTITGEGLEGATEVLFDGVPGTIVGAPTDTEIVVVTPPGAVGAVDVVIVLPGEDVVLVDGYEYLPAPVVVSSNPGQGPVAGGTVVTVDGTGFVQGATTVTICGVTIPVGQVQVNEAGTRLRFTTPPCAAGLASIVVNTAGGSSDALGFRYVAAASTGAGGGGGGSLANTGSDPAPLVGAGLGLLLLGLLTAIALRVRRTA
ncbi:IPT/TIG domain-containing protein [Herbiconiux sp. P15]|uniref:IPT/TIG domain-containing protein n=1 Tax=Herbiconiux liukaitaii TaxID=3342799 RepID=UPI0035B9BF51